MSVCAKAINDPLHERGVSVAVADENAHSVFWPTGRCISGFGPQAHSPEAILTRQGQSLLHARSVRRSSSRLIVRRLLETPIGFHDGEDRRGQPALLERRDLLVRLVLRGQQDPPGALRPRVARPRGWGRVTPSFHG